MEKHLSAPPIRGPRVPHEAGDRTRISARRATVFRPKWRKAMNRSLVLSLSIFCNVGLLVLLGIQHFHSRPPAPVLEHREPKVASASPVTTQRAARFNWRSVESSDYKQYVQNLRSIGCPEETIYDIIVADVNTLYALRSVKSDSAAPWRYWDAEDDVVSREETAHRRLRRDLETEKAAVIKELLGADTVERMKKYQLWGGEENVDRKLAFLSQEKRQALKAIQQKFFELEQDTMEWDANGVLTDSSREKIIEQRRSRDAELRAQLSPDELHEYDLRFSDTASNLRHELNGFHPTEQEFRQLYDLRKNYEEQMNASTDVSDPQVIKAREENEQRLVQRGKEILGEARYAEFLRSQDVDYQNALRLTKYFNLPESAAAEVYALKQQQDAEVAKLRANPNADEDQRLKLFFNLHQQGDARLVEILGQQAFDTYRQNNRWWMRN